MWNIFSLLAIIGYFITSIIIGVSQYIHYGELSSVYIIAQIVIFIISVFLNFKFQESYSDIGSALSILGGGLALMDILQAVLFLIFGRFIEPNMSFWKILLFIIIGIVIIVVIIKRLNRNIDRYY